MRHWTGGFSLFLHHPLEKFMQKCEAKNEKKLSSESLEIVRNEKNAFFASKMKNIQVFDN